MPGPTVKQFVDLVKEGKGFRQHVVLWPKQWRTYNHGALNWTTASFTSKAVPSIPTTSGLYAFTIEPAVNSGLPLAVLVYIGKEESSLRSRFSDYLKEVKNPSGRPKVVYWLHTYRKHVRFSYTTITKISQIRLLESALIDALSLEPRLPQNSTQAFVLGIGFSARWTNQSTPVPSRPTSARSHNVSSTP